MSGAPLRTFNVMRRLARENEVYLVAHAATAEQRDGAQYLRQFCNEVVCAEPRSAQQIAAIPGMLSYLARGYPPELWLSNSPDFVRKTRALCQRVDFDVVQIEHGHMGLALEALPRALRSKAIWMLHDIDFDKFDRIARIEPELGKRLRMWVHSRTMRRWKPRYAERYRRCLTVSAADRELLRDCSVKVRVDVSPNGVDTSVFRPLPDERAEQAMLFVGNMGYRPNVDAVTFFCSEVLPAVRQEIPDVQLWVVGRHPPAAVKGLEGAGVHVTGGVADVVPYYARSRVCVVPIRAGSGTRLKILEAMALGRAVVSTRVGCEGLDVEDGVHLEMADTPEEFAARTIGLLKAAASRRRMTAAARDFVVGNYDWDVIVGRLLECLEDVAKSTDAEPAKQGK